MKPHEACQSKDLQFEQMTGLQTTIRLTVCFLARNRYVGMRGRL